MMRKLLIFIISIVCFSCKEKLRFKRKCSFDNINFETIKKNKVKMQKEFRVSLNSIGGANWKRLETVKVFNEHGLCIMEVNPHYKSLEIDPVEIRKKNLSLLDALSNNKTNIYLGINDSTFYEYDNKNNKIKEVKRTYNDEGIMFNDEIITHKYDNNGNEVEFCLTSEMSETMCKYFAYKYIDGNRIAKSYDSINSPINGRFIVNSYKYEYDAEGNVISDGVFKYKFRDEKLLSIKSGLLYDVFEYSKNGNLLADITYCDVHSDQLTKNDKPCTYFIYQYNDNGLVNEKKNLQDNKVKEVFKYEYDFYN